MSANRTPISPYKGTIASFKDIFPLIPDHSLDTIALSFDMDPPIDVHQPTLCLLEELFCHTVSGFGVPEDWLYKREEVLGTVDRGYYYKHRDRFIAAAQGTLPSPVRIGPHFEHPRLGVTFEGCVQIGGFVYASLTQREGMRRAYLEQRLIALFDPTPRRIIYDYVFGSEVSLLPEIGTDCGALAFLVTKLIVAVSNIRLKDLVVCFDLEWNTNGPDTTIIDAHFMELSTGWTVFSRYFCVPDSIELSSFLIDHNYSVEKLNANGTTIRQLRVAISELENISESILFTAYSGIDTDINILRKEYVYLQNYLDASIPISGGRKIALSKLHINTTGHGFDAHSAASDTQALVRILQVRGLDNTHFWNIHNLIQSRGTR